MSDAAIVPIGSAASAEADKPSSVMDFEEWARYGHARGFFSPPGRVSTENTGERSTHAGGRRRPRWRAPQNGWASG